MQAIISIKYVEGHPETYEYVRVSVMTDARHPDEVRFYGTPIKAYERACAYAHWVADKVLTSSSIDHFVMDKGDFGEYKA